MAVMFTTPVLGYLSSLVSAVVRSGRTLWMQHHKALGLSLAGACVLQSNFELVWYQHAYTEPTGH